MALLETLALTIGPSIGNALLKYWLGENFIVDVASGLNDLVTGWGTDEVERRKMRRQLADVSKQVALQLKPAFDSEVGNMDDSSRVYVVKEVADTLKQAQISAELLVKLNLQPDQLGRYLLSIRPDAMEGAFEQEKHIYKWILFESSNYIVRLATELSGFHNTLAATTLRNQDDILDVLTELIILPDRKDEVFKYDYEQAVARQLDRMELFGVRDLDQWTRHQPLSIAYVTLQVKYGDTHERQQQRGTPAFARGERYNVESSTTSIENVLEGCRRLVVRGEAGSGKSTLLQWIAVRAAHHDFSPNLTSWNNSVPFFIRLRERVGLGFPSPEAFPKSVVPMVAASMPDSGWVHRQLRTGHAIVLVDGVDELPRDQRQMMLDQLAQLVATYPLARYVVTSRPSVLKNDVWPEWDAWVRNEKFIDATLEPLGHSQIELLIQQWHRALAQSSMLDDTERSELPRLCSSLTRLLWQRPSLRSLATSPLLCAMICALHRETRQNLPAERITLYARCVDMLLSDRDKGRQITHLGYPDLSLSQKITLAQNFAYWLMDNEYSDVEISEADTFFEKRLPFMSRLETEAAEVREYFVVRSNLLREPVKGRIEFTHRTFQEYLAAQAVLENDNVGVLLKHAEDDMWRELIILAAGKARPKECERLLNGLIDKGNRKPRRQHQLHLLAVACLETVVEVDPVTRERVLAHATPLFPPKDFDVAKIIAKAGFPAIPLLGAKPEYSEESAAACVRALALIGTDAALKTIASYATDSRDLVMKEVGFVWQVFDRQDYAQLVLAHTNRLIMPHFSSWEGFEHLTHLTELVIENASQMSDLRPLAQLTNLAKLEIGRYLFRVELNEINDLSPISGLTNLTELYLYGCEQVTDLSPLASLTNLKTLYLYGCEQVSDFSPLASLTSLTELFLYGGVQLKELTWLEQLPELTRLSISVCPGIDDLSPLATLTKLTQLRLSNFPQVTNVHPLVTLKELTEISLTFFTQVSDISPLATLPHMTKLDIRGTNAHKASLSKKGITIVGGRKDLED